jgi:superfamily II DNA or RNA helicase
MSPLILTADQRSAVDGILRDIQQPGARVVLCGYAGTGKTVTTAALVTRMQSIGMNVAVATPTHKAKIQVERALRERGANGFTCTTLHALLGLKPSINSSTGKVEFLPDFGKDNKLSHRQTKEFYDRDLGEMVEVSSKDATWPPL